MKGKAAVVDQCFRMSTMVPVVRKKKRKLEKRENTLGRLFFDFLFSFAHSSFENFQSAEGPTSLYCGHVKK